MTRAAKATINLSALKNNVQCVQDAAPKSRILAVIKANGYGHGIARIAKALDEVDALGVASLEEALQIKDAAVQKPIVLLEGMFDTTEVTAMQQNRFQPVIHSQYQIDILNAMAEKNPFGIKMTVWLKLDTGMHRLGFTPDHFIAAFQQLDANRLVSDIILMTHLANADDTSDQMTQQQLQLFHDVIDKHIDLANCQQSVANSAGILGWPKTHVDIVRPGIMLYGGNPFVSGKAVDHRLQPVMTLSSKLIAVNRYKKGERVGYGGAWKCPEDMPVGVVAIGSLPRATGGPNRADSHQHPHARRQRVDQCRHGRQCDSV